MIMVAVVIIEGIQHYHYELPGSILRHVSFSFQFLCLLLIFKEFLLRYKQFYDYAALMIAASAVYALTERGIHMSPHTFMMSHA